MGLSSSRPKTYEEKQKDAEKRFEAAFEQLKISIVELEQANSRAGIYYNIDYDQFYNKCLLNLQNVLYKNYNSDLLKNYAKMVPNADLKNDENICKEIAKYHAQRATIYYGVLLIRDAFNQLNEDPKDDKLVAKKSVLITQKTSDILSKMGTKKMNFIDTIELSKLKDEIDKLIRHTYQICGDNSCRYKRLEELKLFRAYRLKNESV